MTADVIDVIFTLRTVGAQPPKVVLKDDKMTADVGCDVILTSGTVGVQRPRRWSERRTGRQMTLGVTSYSRWAQLVSSPPKVV